MNFDTWIYLIQGRLFMYNKDDKAFYEIKECTPSAQNRFFNGKDKKFYQAIKRVETLRNKSVTSIFKMFN